MSATVPKSDPWSLPPDPDERRRHVRVPWHMAVVVYGERRFVAGTVFDLSEGGCFVTTYDLLDDGERVELTLGFSDGDFPVRGVVAWSRREPGHGDGPIGMGLSFVEPSPELVRAIERFIGRGASPVSAR